jgi:hypothetical protein
MIGLAVAALLGACTPYSGMDGRSYFGFAIGVSNAPPPPRVALLERERYREIPGSQVVVVSDPGADCDVFEYGSTYYMYYGGFWYRSYTSDGAFVTIDVRRVPEPVLRVPPERWRHHPNGGPPGQRKKDWHRGNRPD